MPGKAEKTSKRKKAKSLDPTGVEAIDRLAELEELRLEDYLAAVSGYIRNEQILRETERLKAAQMRLAPALGRAAVSALKLRIPQINAFVGERNVAGALRTVQADVSEFHPLDGLRLAIEIKPVNLAIGRAIWNRFGDIRTFAVNLHLKFPFAVIGGILVIPTYEISEGEKRPTAHLITRAVSRLVRSGGRRNEADAAHLLEAVAVIVYDPDAGTLHHDLPPKGSGLRWDEFINAMAIAYDNRFGEGVGSSVAEAEDETASSDE